MVGAKRSKGALVDLVVWLLGRSEKAEANLDRRDLQLRAEEERASQAEEKCRELEAMVAELEGELLAQGERD